MEATSSAVSLPAEVAGLDASRYERSQAYGVRHKATKLYSPQCRNFKVLLWLVVSNSWMIFHTWDNPNPIDELHHFSEGFKLPTRFLHPMVQAEAERDRDETQPGVNIDALVSLWRSSVGV